MLKPRHIAVAGNIGAGKTSLVKLLAKHYEWKVLLESVEDNPYLADFYADMKQWAFPLQIYFLNSRFRQMQEAQTSPQTVIQDRTIYEDAHIFAENLKANGILAERDFNTYWDIYQSMKAMTQPPDLLIYLRASVATLTSQIARRGRDYEQSISIKYLETLNRQYETWIGKYDESRLLILEADKLDYVHEPEDLGYVISHIDAEFFGLFDDPNR
ncbi:MAG: deoxynucleoside kinase [Bacteroidota bacterium]